MTTAIDYHPEAYTTSGPKLMGRNAAGESFLRGFLSYSKAPEFWVQVQKPEHAQHFAKTAQSFGRTEPALEAAAQATGKEVVLPSEAEIHSVLTAAAGGPKPALELLQAFPGERQPFVFRSLSG